MTGPRLRVAALLVEGDAVLLVRHARRSGPSAWLLPGGGVEADEPLHDAVRRELAEETAVSPVLVEGLAAVAQSIAPPGGERRHVVHLIYACRRLTRSPAPMVSRDPGVAEAAWIPRARLATLTLHPPIADFLTAWTWGGDHAPVELEPRWAPDPPSD